MVFNPHPTGFRTKHWRKLYESYILDINSLRQVVASGGIFVFVDAEPWGADSSKPAEIGLSLLPSLDLITNANTSSTMLWTLDNLSTEHCIETHRFRVLGRDRQEKRRQPHRFGQKYEIVDEEIEKSISDIIQRFTQQHSHPSRQTPIVLAGFSLRFEFCILSGLYPKVLRFFTHWLDLQEVAARVAVMDAKLVHPSLRETLVACGFQDVASQSTKLLHNAATDTTQAAALLVRLMSLREGEELHIQCSSHNSHPRTYRKDPLKKRIWRRRPAPKEIFPYAAKVSRKEGFTMFNTAEPILSLFADHCPVAVGLSGDKKHAWVCLPAFDALEKFIHHVNTLSKYEDAWVATSAYDEAITPAKDMTELRLTQQQNLHALADEKRKQRSRKMTDVCLLEDEEQRVKLEMRQL
ncbi:hypothetical protein VDGL01_04940 [Verticillium dahliae]